MRIQCTCGKFQVDLAAFPKSSPGRMVCYCDDCQAYMVHLGRTDLLDPAGGTEVIPLYPSDVTVVAGADQLLATQLAPNHVYRYSTKCCNSPVGNTRPGFSWLGMQRNLFTVKDPQLLDKTLGEVRARIMGKFAKGPVPKGTADKMNLSAAIAVIPFMLKGRLGNKGKTSPFFAADGAAVGESKVLTKLERADLMKRWSAWKPGV